ncbi:HAD family hydrolase [Streptomyces sp. NPDC051664]|uniref:HAD family hydrolase n=1 Tax=Streptomyces sp. NPDC051664 TaxID=3365668 RepID=UPI00378C9881
MLALFDLDNTLIDRHGGLELWARNFVRSRHLPREAASVVCDQLWERAYPTDFVSLKAALGLHESPDDLWHEYVTGVARSVRCFPGVLEGLEALRHAGWALGVATNGAGDIQRAKLAATGLASLFDGVCVSGDVGVRKPGRGHFEAAIALCGGDLRHRTGHWMVGDNPETDIAGASTAGLRTMWVSNGRRWTYGPREPHTVVRDATEAIDVLQGLTR